MAGLTKGWRGETQTINIGRIALQHTEAQSEENRKREKNIGKRNQTPRNDITPLPPSSAKDILLISPIG